MTLDSSTHICQNCGKKHDSVEEKTKEGSFTKVIYWKCEECGKIHIKDVKDERYDS